MRQDMRQEGKDRWIKEHGGNQQKGNQDGKSVTENDKEGRVALKGPYTRGSWRIHAGGEQFVTN